jgi:AcrR family transcriptional regulator
MPGQKLAEGTRREDILRAAYDEALKNGVEALTLRAVAERAGVSHGTVLFHFRRRDELVASLLDRVLPATVQLHVPDALDGLTPSGQFYALLRAEMDRLSADPRQFRLFLEYWTLGVRTAAIRRRVSVALDAYRDAFETFAEAVLDTGPGSRMRPRTPKGASSTTPQGVAAVAVSLVHGCALQAVIDPKGFDVQQHFAAAARMLERLALSADAA